jgi:IS30 family transposase
MNASRCSSVYLRDGISTPHRWCCDDRWNPSTGLKVSFADPRSPWQRGTNENTNGLLRQYFAEGTDLARWGPDDLTAVAHVLNTRPRKRLGWHTPAEAWNEHLLSIEQQRVATTS